jgi:[ribosomal protein S5]-alanine N-acetyltransferase
MEVKTERLLINPFTAEMICALKSGDYRKLEQMGFISTNEWPEKDLLHALPVFENIVLKNGVNGFGSWIMKEKITNNVIGSLGFIGNPDIDGQIEIGFGVIPSRRKKGFCHEAVNGLLNWIKDKKEVKVIIAHCNKQNIESKNVLSKCGFIYKGEEKQLQLWEKMNV